MEMSILCPEEFLSLTPVTIQLECLILKQTPGSAPYLIAQVACDNAMLVKVDLSSMKNVAEAKLAGPPDVLWYNKKLDHHKLLLYVRE